MADERLQFIIDAKNLASDQFSKVESDLNRASRSSDTMGGKLGALGKVGIIAGIGIATGVGAALVDFAHKAEEEQVNLARLDASLAANVKGYDGNRDAIEKVIESHVRLGFTADEQRASLAGLVAATHDVGKAEEAQSAAMDLARLKHISLQEASDALTKVEGGRFKLLASLGIQLKHGATVEEALAAVRRVSAGQAEAFAKTSEGAWMRFDATLQGIEEKVGSFLLGPLTDIANFLSDNLPSAIDLFDAHAQEIGIALAAIGTVVALTVVPPFLAWAAATLIALAPLFLLAAAVVLVGTHLAELRGFVEQLFEPLARLNDLVGQIPVPWHDAAPKIDKDAKDIALSVAYVGDGFDKLPGKAKDDMDATVHAIAASKASTSSTAADVIGEVAKRVAGARAAIYGAAVKDAQGMAQGLLDHKDDVGNAGQALADALLHPVSAAKRIAHLQGLLRGKDIADGLKSSDPYARDTAEKYRLAIQAEIDRLKGYAGPAGNAIGTYWIKGIAGGIIDNYAALTHELARVAGDMHGKSPPKTGPLSTLTARPIGEWWAKTLAAGIRESIAGVQGALSDIGGAMPGVGGMAFAGAGGGSALAFAGGGSSVTQPDNHVHVYLDGEEVTNIIDRRIQSRMAPGGFGPGR